MLYGCEPLDLDHAIRGLNRALGRHESSKTYGNQRDLSTVSNRIRMSRYLP